MIDWIAHFETGLGYRDFLSKYGTLLHSERWHSNLDSIELTESQKTLLGSFRRQMKVICLAGTWCGDCANQCPIFQRIVESAPNGSIDLRFLDRDAISPEFGSALKINGGQRVPALIFISEDGQEVARYGEKTLAKYRDEAARLEGISCSIGLGSGVPDKLRESVIAEWVDQFERAQLILRLSARLRSKYGD
ncbi:MAG: thioredoxin family protein [Planctomycetota bacterium]|nr:thioredoxin family protein [Planctomycetota bacterium]RLT10437.1 MAG: thiol reductase thioredoxin [Planctomycetota bacterium]